MKYSSYLCLIRVGNGSQSNQLTKTLWCIGNQTNKVVNNKLNNLLVELNKIDNDYRLITQTPFTPAHDPYLFSTKKNVVIELDEEGDFQIYQNNVEMGCYADIEDVVFEAGVVI